MSLKTKLNAARKKIIDLGGTQIRIQYFTQIQDLIYDDVVELNQSGADLWTSGLIFPINNKPGHSDSLLVEQGKLLYTDSKLFMHGSLLLTGSELSVKISIGSPVNSSYSIIPPGPYSQSVQNTPIYKVCYIRKIGGTGSLFGE